MTDQKIDYHSIVNQRILGDFVNRDVIMNASMLVEDLLEAGKLSYDDIENLYRFDRENLSDEDEKEYQELQNKVTLLNDIEDYATNHKVRKELETVLEEIADFENDHSEDREIYEWWFVTEFLYKDLKAKGQPVIDSNYGYLWGRCTTGQAILLDGVIGSIAEDMEILEGQKKGTFTMR